MKRSATISRQDVLLLIGLNIIWGSTYVVARNVLDTAPTLVLAVARLMVAALWMLVFRSHHAPKGAPSLEAVETRPTDLWTVAFMGVVGFGLSKLLAFEGMLRSTATDAALIVNLEAVFTAVLGFFLLHQKLNRRQWFGIALACAGGVALVWPSGLAAPAPARTLGNLLLVGSMAAEAMASVLGAGLLRRYSGRQVTAYGTYWGVAALVGPGLWQWHAHTWTTHWITWPNVASIIFLALGCSVMAYALWYQILGRVDAGRAAAFLYLQPLVGVTLGILIRHEWPTWLGLSGGGLVLAGIYLAA